MNNSSSGSTIAESELRALLLEYRRENWNGIQTPEVQARVVEDLLRADWEGPLHEAKAYIGLSDASRILDVGSGVGGFVVACRRQGLNAFGLEPDRIGQGAKVTSIQIARRRIAEPVFVSGIGEKLPFPDACFDFVTMNQVIEHVSDQRAVLRETVRVLRQGGAIYVTCPNYLRFYEPHYRVFWLPLMPKVLGRLYLSIRGRSPAMLNQLTYTTNNRVRKLLAELGPGFTVLDLNRERFLKKLAVGSFAARSTRMVTALTRLPLIGWAVLWAILKYAAMTGGGCEMLVLRAGKAETE
jgi:SAM-dependent methyltransferase